MITSLRVLTPLVSQACRQPLLLSMFLRLVGQGRLNAPVTNIDLHLRKKEQSDIVEM